MAVLCDTRLKIPCNHPLVLLHPCQSPLNVFLYWTIYFVMGLNLDNFCYTIFIYIDKLTKLVCLVPCAAGERELSAAAIKKFFMHHIVKCFGVP